MTGYEKLYTSLSQLGISTSTTTLANVWDKLPNNAEAKLDKNLFTDAMPNTDSAFILFEKLTVARGKITYYTKDNNNTYLMCLNSSNIPTGTWQELATMDKAGMTIIPTKVNNYVCNILRSSYNVCVLHVYGNNAYGEMVINTDGTYTNVSGSIKINAISGNVISFETAYTYAYAVRIS